MVSNADVILQSVMASSSKRFEGKSYTTSLSGLMLNYSSAFVQKPVENKDVLALFLRIVDQRLAMEKEETNQQNYLISVGNVLSKYPQVKPQAQFAKNYARGDALSRDLGRLLN